MILIQKIYMSQVQLEEFPSISIKQPFTTKFFKELDQYQSSLCKRVKKKIGQVTLSAAEKTRTIKKSIKSEERVINGNRIIANWKSKKLDGEVEIYYSNGIIFKGFYQNGIKVRGTFELPNGYQYSGACFGNKFAGEGQFTFPSGKTVIGEWNGFQVVGNGRIEYESGEIYYGQIANLRKHGIGNLFFIDGSKYVGQFENGRMKGKGTYYDMNGNVVVDGDWLDDEIMIMIDEETFKDTTELQRHEQEINSSIKTNKRTNILPNSKQKAERKVTFKSKKPN